MLPPSPIKKTPYNNNLGNNRDEGSPQITSEPYGRKDQTIDRVRSSPLPSQKSLNDPSFTTPLVGGKQWFKQCVGPTYLRNICVLGGNYAGSSLLATASEGVRTDWIKSNQQNGPALLLSLECCKRLVEGFTRLYNARNTDRLFKGQRTAQDTLQDSRRTLLLNCFSGMSTLTAVLLAGSKNHRHFLLLALFINQIAVKVDDNLFSGFVQTDRLTGIQNIDEDLKTKHRVLWRTIDNAILRIIGIGAALSARHYLKGGNIRSYGGGISKYKLGVLVGIGSGITLIGQSAWRCILYRSSARATTQASPNRKSATTKANQPTIRSAGLGSLTKEYFHLLFKYPLYRNILLNRVLCQIGQAFTEFASTAILSYIAAQDPLLALVRSLVISSIAELLIIYGTLYSTNRSDMINHEIAKAQKGNIDKILTWANLFWEWSPLLMNILILTIANTIGIASAYLFIALLLREILAGSFGKNMAYQPWMDLKKFARLTAINADRKTNKDPEASEDPELNEQNHFYQKNMDFVAAYEFLAAYGVGFGAGAIVINVAKILAPTMQPAAACLIGVIILSASRHAAYYNCYFAQKKDEKEEKTM